MSGQKPSGEMSSVLFTKIRKNETIVHEVGHALGLAHCASAYNSISVMRATGFNDVAAPLMYDGYSIAKLY